MSEFLRLLGEGAKLVTPPLIMILGGSFVVQRFFIQKSNQAQAIDYLIKALSEIQKQSILYWTTTGSSSNKDPEIISRAQLIKAELRSFNADLESFCEKYKIKDRAKIEKDVAEVFDTCTGGDFESEKRKVEPQRTIFIVNSIGRVKSRLIRMKL